MNKGKTAKDFVEQVTGEPPQAPMHAVFYLADYIDLTKGIAHRAALRKHAIRAFDNQSIEAHAIKEVARRKANDRAAGICTECGSPADYDEED